jgi:hypothetical protein
MQEKDIKTEKLIEILRKSKPGLLDPENLTNQIMQRIQLDNIASGPFDFLINFFFGWVYVGWVRKSFVTISFLILVFFGYQQVVILNRIDELSERSIRETTVIKTGYPGKIDLQQKLEGFSGFDINGKNLNINEKELKKMIRSMTELREKYKDIFFLIENDPELRQYIQQKLDENLEKQKN